MRAERLLNLQGDSALGATAGRIPGRAGPRGGVTNLAPFGDERARAGRKERDLRVVVVTDKIADGEF